MFSAMFDTLAAGDDGSTVTLKMADGLVVQAGGQVRFAAVWTLHRPHICQIIPRSTHGNDFGDAMVNASQPRC